MLIFPGHWANTGADNPNPNHPAKKLSTGHHHFEVFVVRGFSAFLLRRAQLATRPRCPEDHVDFVSCCSTTADKHFCFCFCFCLCMCLYLYLGLGLCFSTGLPLCAATAVAIDPLTTPIPQDNGLPTSQALQAHHLPPLTRALCSPQVAVTVVIAVAVAVAVQAKAICGCGCGHAVFAHGALRPDGSSPGR